MLISYDDESLLDNVDIRNYPNEIVDKNYKTFKRLLKYYNIKYHKLYLHHKGGIYFIFKKNNVEVFVEIFNDKILNYFIQKNKKIIENKNFIDFNEVIKILIKIIKHV